VSAPVLVAKAPKTHNSRPERDNKHLSQCPSDTRRCEPQIAKILNTNSNRSICSKIKFADNFLEQVSHVKFRPNISVVSEMTYRWTSDSLSQCGQKKKKHEMEKGTLIYKTIILPVVLYGGETWSLT
jgi:hypothetical protein